MGITDIIKKSFLEGYATSDINVTTVFVCLAATTLMAAYIFVVYRSINKNSFYDRGFNLSLMGMAVITAMVILTIQSNIVVSLGMVGALSIVRFRTAIKAPMDLVFLFWAISVGIICGAGFVLIAVIGSLGLTVILLLFAMMPDSRGNLLLVVNAENYKDEAPIMAVVDQYCAYSKVRARNITRNSLNMAIDVKSEDTEKLIDTLMGMPSVTLASLVEHDGDVTA